MAVKKKKRSWFSEMLSGRGTISAKRVCGVWLIILVSACTLWHVIVHGIDNTAEDLLETELIVATALLGLTSVTGIFKRARVSVGAPLDGGGCHPPKPGFDQEMLPEEECEEDC